MTQGPEDKPKVCVQCGADNVSCRGLCGKCYYKYKKEKDPDGMRQKKRLYYEKNRDRILEQSRKRYAESPRQRSDELNAYKRDWYARNPHKGAEYRERRKDKVKWWWRESAYGVSKTDYMAMSDKQDGVCAICGSPPPEGWLLCVDHDHSTGVFRGLLCKQCNLAIGNLRDSVDMAFNAAKYLAERVGGSNAA